MNTDNTDATNMLQEMAQVSGPVELREETNKRISSANFQNTKKTTEAWLSENKELREMHDLAIEDYITSRHAVLELGLFKSGLSLSAQAIEKLLKCYLLASGLTIKETRKYSHNIKLLLEKAHETSKQSYLLNFSGFCDELMKWYNSRYPDASNPASNWMRSAISEFDEFVCYLEEHMPIPNEVKHLKYGGGELGTQWSSIFVRLFGTSFGQHKFALLKENSALADRASEWEEKFYIHRLAAAIPSSTQSESIDHNIRMQTVINKYENN